MSFKADIVTVKLMGLFCFQEACWGTYKSIPPMPLIDPAPCQGKLVILVNLKAQMYGIVCEKHAAVNDPFWEPLC